MSVCVCCPMWGSEFGHKWNHNSAMIWCVCTIWPPLSICSQTHNSLNRFRVRRRYDQAPIITDNTMAKRSMNFAAGPAKLPESVLEEAAAGILDYQGTGCGVMEISHR